jgi:DNA polymerase-3 subunit gamma/tau
MSEYLVSARKYRPLKFENVIGQEHVTTTLNNAIQKNQIAHAYLFCGPRGVGKTTCARIFAQLINENTHSEYNIFELDGASNNSVDDIRTLIEQVKIPPQIGKYKTYIIDEVHMLSKSAFNAFLKTLEEPPKHSIFILATTEKEKIIPTILSRCQIFDFNRISNQQISAYLLKLSQKEKIQVNEKTIQLIAEKADGSLRDALSIFDRIYTLCNDSWDHSEAECEKCSALAAIRFLKCVIKHLIISLLSNPFSITLFIVNRQLDICFLIMFSTNSIANFASSDNNIFATSA